MVVWQIPIIIVLVISFLLIYWLRLRDFLLPVRLLRQDKAEANEPEITEWERISIIIPCHNQGEQLLASLPNLLGQDYPWFEVIVCDEISTDDTLSMLSPLEKQYPNLRHRAIPASSRGITPRQLSITLGMRAARGEWVVITSPDSSPRSNQWLRSLAREFTSATSVVVGYGSYMGEACADAPRRIYDYLHYQMMNLRAIRRGRPFTLDLSGVAMRRSIFLESGGYTGSLGHRSGEGEQLAAALMSLPEARDADFTAICHSTDGVVFREMPDAIGRRLSRRSFRAGLRSGSRRLLFYRWREGLASMMYLLFAFFAIGYIAYTVWMLSQGTAPTSLQRIADYYQSGDNVLWWQVGMDGTVILLVLCFLILPHVVLHKCCSSLELEVPRMHPNYYMLTQPLVHLRDSFLSRFR